MTQRPPDDPGPYRERPSVDLDFHIDCIKRARKAGAIDGAVIGAGLSFCATGMVFLLIKIFGG
jgi:hypothetical protein